MDALIVHMIFNPAVDVYKSSNNSGHEEFEATLIPFSPCPDVRQARDIPTACSTRLRNYHDSGATICLGGLKYMGLSIRNLVP